METADSPVPPYSIRAHFSSTNSGVFLTGATGYVGSLVLEKLLRSTDCRRIYVLLRPRRGRTPAERLAHLLRSPLFHRLRPPYGDAPPAADSSPAANAEAATSLPGAAAIITSSSSPVNTPSDSSPLRPIDPAVLARVVAVSGDILLPGLGLSEADVAELAATVDTVIHAAADIRLEAHIHETLRANYGGTLAVLNLASRLPRLRSVVHVSTCYVNIDRPRGTTVEERLYPLTLAGSPLDPIALALELLSMPPSEATARAAGLIRYFGLRNTYALGKRLAEAAAVKVAVARGLPLAVLRPSLVSAVAQEPYCGFAGNAAGLVGANLSYIVGLYDDQPSSVAADADSIWDVVPGDLVAHAIIATAAAAAETRRLRLATSASLGPTAGPAATSSPSSLSNGTPSAAPLLVVQAATSTTYPITTADIANAVFAFVGAHRRPWTLALRRGRPMVPGQRWDPVAWRRNQWWTFVKVRVAAWLCRLLGLSRAARLLEGGHATLTTINQPQYDLNLAFSTNNLLALEAALAPEERDGFLLAWRPPSTTDSDGGHAGCTAGSALQTEAVAVPAADCPGSGSAQAAAAAAAAGIAGVDRLGVGIGLLGSGGRSSDVGAGSSGQASSSWGRCSDDDGSSGSDGNVGRQAAARGASATATEGEGGAAPLSSSSTGNPAAQVPMGWREYQNTMAAYLYHKLFGLAVPQAAPVPPGRLRALRALAPQAPLAGVGVGSGGAVGGEWGPVVVHRFAPVER